MPSYRYPGAQPFTTAEEHIFFGRKEDIEALHRQVRLEPLLVLYAKSGLGKSSLLHAGLIPAILEEGKYIPISIRFNAYNPLEEASPGPLEVTRQAIRQASQESTEATYLEQLFPTESSLWYLLKRAQAQTKNQQQLLLIFDQFEELFTYPDAAIQAFKEELAEVLYTQIPQRFRSKVEEEVEHPKRLTPEELALLHQAIFPHVIMAIRSDRISLLNRLVDHLPTVKRSWYELGALKLEQAEDAILNPAYMKGAFISPIFDYDDEALQQVLNFLTQHQSQQIESFQLQILCQAIERKVIRQGLTIVTADDLGNIEKVYENYYSDQIESIASIEDQLLSRRFIEEGLIFEEEERRISLYEGQVFSQFGLSPELLRQLEDTHLIRREPSLKGGFTYELSHDTLVGPVLKAKALRLTAEQKVLEEEESRRKEKELQAAQEKAAAERKLRRQAEKNESRARKGTRLALLISFIALVFAGFASWMYLRAQEESERANAQETRAKDNEKAAQYNLKTALNEKERAEEALNLLEEQQKLTAAEKARAESNLQIARLEKTRSEKARVQLQEQSDSIRLAQEKLAKALDAALTEKKRAERNLVLFERQIDSTNAAREQASTNQAKLQETNRMLAMEQVVSESARLEAIRYLAQADEAIRKLEYEAALENIKNADALEVIEDSVALAYLELVFWYNEIGQFDRALGILDSAAIAAQRPAFLRSNNPLPRGQASARKKISALLKNFDRARFQQIQQRYFPIMVLVQGGAFNMGCDPTIDEKCELDEFQHAAAVSDFYMAKYETTWWQYILFCTTTDRSFKSPKWGIHGDHPVVNITWKEALQYANWLSDQQGLRQAFKFSTLKPIRNSKGYRLPSEAEWEYAAKGGRVQQKFIYSGGNNLDSVGWHLGNSGGSTQAVGQMKANQLGIYDMSGNVWEWCFDYYKPAYLKQPPADYFGPDSGSDRVLRGGSWFRKEAFNRTSFRFSGGSDIRIDNRGFRMVRSK